MSEDLKHRIGGCRYAIYGLIFLIPRIVRFFHPKVWAEDAIYAYEPFLMNRGYISYIDLPKVNLNVLEWMLALWYRLFGASYQSVEAFNCIFLYISAWLIFLIGRKFIGEIGGFCAALLFSTHYLVFRYQFLEREPCLIAGSLLMFLIMAKMTRIFGRRKTDKSRIFQKLASRRGGLSILLWVVVGVWAFSVKQTAVVPAAALLAWYAFGKKRFRDAILLGLCYSAGVCLLMYVYWRIYGTDFLLETVLFHFVKGATMSNLLKLKYMLMELKYLVPLGVVSLIWTSGLYIKGRYKDKRRFLLWVGIAVLLELLFYYRSSVFWPHYILTLLPALCLFAGLGLQLMADSIFRKKENGTGWNAYPYVLASLAFVVLSSQLPALNPRLPPAQRWGFGTIPKCEVSEAARFIRANVSEDEKIVSDAFIALCSNREKLVPCEDNYGALQWVMRGWKTGQWNTIKEMAATIPFGAIKTKTRVYWWPEMKLALERNEVKAVIMPYFELPFDENFLKRIGYRLAFANNHYRVWLPDKTEESPIAPPAKVPR